MRSSTSPAGNSACQVRSNPASAARAVTVVVPPSPCASSAKKCTSSCRAASPPRPAAASTCTLIVADMWRSRRPRNHGRGSSRAAPVAGDRQPAVRDRGDLGGRAPDRQPAGVVQERGVGQVEGDVLVRGRRRGDQVGLRPAVHPAHRGQERLAPQRGEPLTEPDRPHPEQHHGRAAVRRLDEVGVPEVLHGVLRAGGGQHRVGRVALPGARGGRAAGDAHRVAAVGTALGDEQVPVRRRGGTGAAPRGRSGPCPPTAAGPPPAPRRSPGRPAPAGSRAGTRRT